MKTVSPAMRGEFRGFDRKKVTATARWLHGLVVGAAACVLAGQGMAQDLSRIVVLQVPIRDAAAVRAELAGAPGTQVQTMDAVMKKHALKPVIDKSDRDPWVSRTFERDGQTLRQMHLYESETSAVPEGLFGKEVSERSQVAIGPDAHHLGMREKVSSKMALPASKTSQQALTCENDMIWVRPGRWNEVAMWGSEREEVTVWQFATVGTPLPAKPAPEKGAVEVTREMWRMEVLLFQSTPDDIEKLAKSEAASRENALKWLQGRAKLWRTGSHLSIAQTGNRLTFDEREPKGTKAAASTSAGFLGLGWSSDPTKTGTAKEISWSVETSAEGAKKEFKTTAEPGIWTFVPLADAKANVMAYRLVKL